MTQGPILPPSAAGRGWVAEAVQAKYHISAPADPLEREADQAAASVLAGRVFTGLDGSDIAERKSSRGHLSGWGREPGAPLGADDESVDAMLTRRVEAPGVGRRLPEGLRREMEVGLRADFSRVQVHDAPPDRVTASHINARAFTVRNHVFLGPGESVDDRRLMAHELAHVVQQQGSGGAADSSVRASVGPRDAVLRTPGDRQTMRLSRRYRYMGRDGAFQSHHFEPDLQADLRDWLTGRMRVLVGEERPFDVNSRRLVEAFRQAHQTIGTAAQLRNGQRYTYEARIDISGALVRISEVKINGIRLTSEVVLQRFEGMGPMTWAPAGSPGFGCATDFCSWVTAQEETPAPSADTATTANCWEAILLAAYQSRLVTWRWLHDLYDRYEDRGFRAFANMMTRGRRRLYAPPRQVPARGDIVFYWSGRRLSHVALATGGANGSSPEVIEFQGQLTGPAVRPRRSGPSVMLYPGGRMRIEYAPPAW